MPSSSKYPNDVINDDPCLLLRLFNFLTTKVHRSGITTCKPINFSFLVSGKEHPGKNTVRTGFSFHNEFVIAVWYHDYIPNGGSFNDQLSLFIYCDSKIIIELRIEVL